MKFLTYHSLIFTGILLFLAVKVKSHAYYNDTTPLAGKKESCEEDENKKKEEEKRQNESMWQTIAEQAKIATENVKNRLGTNSYERI